MNKLTPSQKLKIKIACTALAAIITAIAIVIDSSVLFLLALPFVAIVLIVAFSEPEEAAL